jgi:uncharacterized membrane protein (Fun14 family)
LTRVFFQGAIWGPVVGICFMVIGFFAEIGIFMIKAEQLNETLEKRENAEKVTFPGHEKPGK